MEKTVTHPGVRQTADHWEAGLRTPSLPGVAPHHVTLGKVFNPPGPKCLHLVYVQFHRFSLRPRQFLLVCGSHFRGQSWRSHLKLDRKEMKNKSLLKNGVSPEIIRQCQGHLAFSESCHVLVVSCYF